MEQHLTDSTTAVETKTYQVQGLSCVDCAGRIEAAVARLDGVDGAKVDVALGTLTFRVLAPEFDIAPVAKIVEDTGHKLVTENAPVAGTVAVPMRRGVAGFVDFMLSSRDTRLTTAAALLTLAGLAIRLRGCPSFPWTRSRWRFWVGGLPIARHAFQEVFGRAASGSAR